MEPRINRREFTKGVAGAAVAAQGLASVARGADDKKTVRLGVIGCGGRGKGVGTAFSQLAGVEMICVCDPDKEHAADAQKRMNAARACDDLRQLLEDDKIDAVIIATPDHWHTPAALLALEAGKHVYVEKPCSHNVREGRLLVDAARKHKRHVQHGTQSRSMAGIANAVEELKKGVIGEVLVAKVINSQMRGNIGHSAASSPPAQLDFDLWLGPAPNFDFQPNLVHYGWHWFYPFGTGDIGNDGVHQLDVARWGLNVNGHPSRVTGWGTKLFFDDDQQFPDSYILTYEYPGVGPRGMPLALIFEQRIWTDYETESCENGNIFYGSEGKMIVARGRMQIIGKKNKIIREETFERADTPHFENFLEVVRGNAETLNAEIEVGHYASSLSHLGNIVARTGRNISFDPVKETIADDPESDKLLTREYRPGHWAIPKGLA